MDKILSMLGLAEKAGRLVSGEFATEKAVKGRKAYLVVVAEDASDNTKKLFFNKCRSYSVPVRVYSDRETIGRALGCGIRASLAVTDPGFAGAILKRLDGDGSAGKGSYGDQNI